MAERENEPIFQDLKAGVENIGATEIESLCMNCYENVSFLWKVLGHVLMLYLSTSGLNPNAADKDPLLQGGHLDEF